MNHHDPSKHDAAHEVMKLSPEDEREWRLQEQALHDERTQRDRQAAAASDDVPLSGQYRLVVHALRQESSAVPADFAALVLEAVHKAPVVASSELERWLLRGLFAALVLSGLAVATVYGGQWLQGVALLWSQAPATSHNWLLALGACIGVTWSLRWLRWPHAPSNSG